MQDDFQVISERTAVKTLEELVSVALGDTGQSRYVRLFLLGLYNGDAWPFSLYQLRGIDGRLKLACLKLLKLDAVYPAKEIHQYIADGSTIFRNLADIQREEVAAKAEANRILWRDRRK
ncbi:MAG: hypothetical protein Q7U82_04970 [Gammaproteobacteria bacterium]|nr:hypothetical protein [Gammaproteobacteria bacterium]